MTAQLAPRPNFKGWDNNGSPLAFGLLTTYAAGTTTPIATYVDSTQTTQNLNPIQLNFRGECNLWLDPTKSYKFLLQDLFGNTIPGWPVDNITIGNANPTYSIIPGTNNLYTLGSPSFSWANVYLGVNGLPLLDASGNAGFVARTAAEIAASVTPTDYFYPEGDLRRYGGLGNGTTDDSTAWQSAISVGIARIPKGFSFKIVTPATKTGQVTILGEGKTSKLLCDSTVLTVTSGTGSVVDNFWMENITAPWIITRNPANWAANISGTLQQSNIVLGYQPTSNDTDIWSTLTAPQQNQQIGPTIQFVLAASLITVSRIYGRFVRVDIHDATESQIIDCDVRGGKGVWGALTFNNADANIQRGVHNRAINNRVSYPSFSGVFFSSNDDFTCRGNVCYLGGESGVKTLQAFGFVFVASVGGATSGTLSPAVTNGVYSAVFSDGEGRSVTVTGGTAASWSGALNAGGVLSASAWQSTLNPQCFRGQIVDNHCYQMYYDGLDCDSTSATATCDAAGTFHQIHNNYAYQNGGDGINTDGQFNSCVGNRLIQNYRYGIWGICSFSVVSDNACVDNNQQRNSGNHDITVGGPNQTQNFISGNYVWAGGTQNNFGIYAPGLNKIGDNYGVGSNFFFGNPGAIPSVVQNYNDASTGLLTDQSFVLILQNNTGTIQHKIIDDATGLGLGNYSSRINNASVAFTTTPSVDSTHAFAAGGGIVAAATSQFLFDTAVQVSANDQMVASLENNSSGTALCVSCLLSNLNVNNVTRTRLVLQFGNASTDAAFALTGLTAGQYIKVRFYGKLA